MRSMTHSYGACLSLNVIIFLHSTNNTFLTFEFYLSLFSSLAVSTRLRARKPCVRGCLRLYEWSMKLYIVGTLATEEMLDFQMFKAIFNLKNCGNVNSTFELVAWRGVEAEIGEWARSKHLRRILAFWFSLFTSNLGIDLHFLNCNQFSTPKLGIFFDRVVFRFKRG